MKKTLVPLFITIAASCVLGEVPSDQPRQVSGIYPSLAMFNKEGECGTGAVVPWADRLWAITYAPHRPYGSSDKLYEITPDLKQIVRSESVGGTPADRMIHRETNQLLIGPYVIDGERNVRVIKPSQMPGRLTAVARHLVDPATSVYYATMEEGLYSVDLKTLNVTELIKDTNRDNKGLGTGVVSDLPGYHGKGLYSGQERLVYANNGEYGHAAETDPTTPSGALAEWRKPGENWTMIRRNQFTEVTGPGGIYGNSNPETDPLWAVGWDFRSLILMVLDKGTWHSYRLPKASHSYDGAHGWNTEWPRIREIGEGSLLMTMHGGFWKFPKNFAPSTSAGISPRSNYLKVVGDFARWNDRIVIGCDDTAKNEFLNKRKAKGEIVGPGQSQSNLWFIDPTLLDHLGPVIGRGALWLNEDVKKGTTSDPYLFSGFDYRTLALFHNGAAPVRVAVEVDVDGNGTWTPSKTIDVLPGALQWADMSSEKGAWIRLRPEADAKKLTAMFLYRNQDGREVAAAKIFDGIAAPDSKQVTGGLLYARGNDIRTLRFAAQDASGDLGCYDLDGNLTLTKVDEPDASRWMNENVAIPSGVLEYDDASIIYVDQVGRWRLPRGDRSLDTAGPLGAERICREVCTERDLFNAGGTFFELPAENAGGAAKIRAVTTHNRRIKDYTSFRGLFVISGLDQSAQAGDHVIRSTDGKTALWVGAVDDIWRFGKPRGFGGPWKNAQVEAGKPSDPYLLTGYDKKSLTLSHDATVPVKITVEIDPSGTGTWVPWKEFSVPAGESVSYQFPDSFSAYWLRTKSDSLCKATAQLTYE
ncbi:hypothetical protein TSACC_21449 [Terrimicrobium sacchariphilum]|uniref:Uncharacterized protein n=1 Tax=Terrimicrobium sacchariphilum TaxID=690879 RepID=A0A146G807_TERSA|nr:hypothetical protein [Terrimicrobium sacchariphilum]GAT33044.1 hypothetical protein TSACC_21449 [Terrimicrobium sacchariphilum]